VTRTKTESERTKKLERCRAKGQDCSNPKNCPQPWYCSSAIASFFVEAHIENPCSDIMTALFISRCDAKLYDKVILFQSIEMSVSKSSLPVFGVDAYFNGSAVRPSYRKFALVL